MKCTPFVSSPLRIILLVLAVLSTSLVAKATTVATPTFSPAAGSYTGTQSVTIHDTTSGATIFYTTNGNTPNSGSTRYTGTISVSTSETIKAIAELSGDTNSAVASAAYTITVPAPAFSPAAGSYTGTQSVTISDAMSGVTIYYTTDGSTPTTNSTRYTGAISVSASETVKAIGVLSGATTSTPASAAYTITPLEGTLTVYIDAPTVQSSSVSGVTTQTFDSLPTGKQTTNFVWKVGSSTIGTYAASSTVPFDVHAPGGLYGGANNTNYFSVGGDSGSTSPTFLTLSQPASYVGFWWAAGDANNRVALYSGSTLYGTFSTADLLKILNNGSGTVTALSGSTYNTSAYFGNPNLTAPNNDSGEPFAYVSFVITGATITQIAFYNTNTSSSFESDNHSIIFSGTSFSVPTTFVPVESMSIGTQPVTVTVAPASANVSAGGTQQFTATVTGSSNTAVNWTISPTTGAGTVNTSGLYTAPATVTTPRTATITATSQANTAVSASGTVNLRVTPTLSVASSSNPSTYGNSVTFTATISSGPTGTITFYDGGVSIGTGTISGTTATLMTTSLAAGSHTITAGWAGNTNYSAVTSSAITQTVNQAAPTISFTVPNQTDGVAPFTVSATSNSSGAITYSVVSGPATISGSTVTITGVGTVALKASQVASGNYAAGTQTTSFTVAAAAPTITFTVPNQTYGVAPFTVSATSNSSGAITYSVVSGPATISGSTVTITGVGTVVLQASQAASGNYAAGTQTASFTVVAAGPTITFTVPNQTYGVAPFTVSATSNSSGVITYSVVSGPATISGSTVTITGVGTVVLQASQAASGNYAAGTQTASFTVAAAGPTITFTVPNQTYGVAPFTVSATSNSSGAITYSVVSGPATISGSTVTITGVGTVALKASQVASGNYAAGTQNASFTVTAEAQTITFTALASPVTYGVAPVALSASASSGLAVIFSIVSGSGTISGSTLTITGPGTVVVAANQPGNADFSAAPQVTQSIVVNSAVSITLTPFNAVLTGGQSQQFTATVMNTTNTAVNWSISPTGVGSISSSGLYTAQATIGGQQVVTITATSQADTSATATATVNLAPACATNGYSYVRAITIDHTKVPNTDQINFPFLFNTTDPLLATSANGGHVASPDGYDIIFTSDSAGQNPLPYEMEEYNPATGQVIAWVQIPDISHSSDTVIYLFYGNPNISAPQQNPTAVWNANYQAVWHLPNGTTLSANDSTANANNAIIQGSPAAISGEIWGGASFNSGSYLVPANYISLSSGTYTLSTWFQTPLPTTNDGWNTLFRGSEDHEIIVHESDWTLGSYDNTGGTGYNSSGFAISSLSSGWHYLVAVSSGSTLLFYVDGNYVGASSFLSTNDVETIGNYRGDGNQQWGSADEIRVSNSARSADWIATEYANQGSPATFYSLTAENAVEAVPTAVSLLASQSQQFSIPGMCSGAVAWSMPNNSLGSLSSSGLYTAPASFTEQQAVTITGQTQAENLTSATVTLVPQIWPNGGPAGTVVTINGAGFGSTEGPSSVTVGGLPAVTLAWSASQIQVQIPTGTGVGNQNVAVTVGGQTVSSTTFNVTAGLTGITPPLNAPAGVSGSVTINTSGQTGPLIFYASQGQVVSIAIGNDTFNSWSGSVNMTVLNPDGTFVASPSFCTATAFGCALLSHPIALQQTGLYTLKVDPSGATGGTNFTLWLYANLTDGTITPGIPKTTTIDIPGQQDVLTFSGVAGQIASVGISNDTLTSWNGTVTLSIIDPDGTTPLYSNSLCDFAFIGCALHTNPVVLPKTGIYTLSVDPGGGTGSVTLLLTQTASFTINPTSVTLWGSQVQQFTATVNGDTNSPVDWTLTPATGAGTISSMGLYTAPATISTQQTVTVTATTVATPTQPVSATVTLIPHEVTVAPSTAVLYSGQAQTFTATCTASCPASMSWTASPSGLGTLTPNGFTASFTAPANITAQQTVTITATNPIDNTYAPAVVTLMPPALTPTLSLAAIAPSPYPTGASQAFFAILKNRDGTPLSGGAVTFTVTGANNNSGSVITDSTGTATYLYTGVHSGNDVVHATAIIGSEQVTSNSVSATWITPTQPISNTTVTGRFYLSDGSGIFDTPLGTQPVFVQTFPSLIFNPPSGTIPGLTTVNNNSRPFTNVTTDANGNVTGTIVAQGNGYQAGCGPSTGGSCDPNVLGDMTQFQAVFSGEFTVANAGTITFTYLYDDSFILGIGNGAAPASDAPILNAPAFTTFDQLPTMGSVGLSFSSPPSISVNFPGPGTYPFEVDYVECCSGPLILVITASGTGSAGVPTTGSLMLSPDSVSPQPAGGSQTFTVFATDVSGNPLANANVGLVVTGDDELQLSGTTDSTGHATIVYNDVNPGTAYVQAVAFMDGMVTYSDQVTVTWTSSGGGGTGSGGGGGLTQGWIGSPANGSGVSGIVPITVAAGETLTSGTLSYYPASNPADVTVLNSAVSGSAGQQMGTLDATALPNGTYWITLQATDSTGNSQYSLSLVTVTGNYKPGRVTTTITDLVVPATGLPIQIQRTYDSLSAGTIGDFGYGWNLGINTQLTVDNKGDVTFTLGGQRKTFYLTPQMLGCGLVGCLFPWYSPVFTPEPGLFGTLTDSGSGCVLDMLLADGECVGGGQYTPPGYIYTDPSGTAYTIGAGGQLQSVLDKNGNGLTIGPNGITSTTGLNVPFVRDAQNRITQITDPAGNVYSYGYDASGNLASVTYPPTPNAPTCPGANSSNTSQYSYYPNAEHPNYPAHFFAGGTDGRCYSLPSTTFYDSSNDGGNSALDGRLASVTDAAGNTTSYNYELSTTSTINGVQVPNTGVTTITYPTDPADGSGQTATATMIYDSQGDLLQSTDPLGHTTLNTYDPNRNLLWTTDPLGHTTSYSYDANGNKTSTTYPATATSTNTTSYTNYNQFSEPVSTTDEDGNTRAFTYDANYNPLAVTDSAGTLMSTQFNTAGQMLSGVIGYDLAQAPAHASQFTYDANGNLISKTDALGRTTSYTYNALGQKTTMTEPIPSGGTAAQATSTYTYDAFGNLTETQAPLGRTTYSTYDANGNKLSDTDARGNVTNYKYDALNRLVETDYPDGTKKTVDAYDFRGNVVTETDQNGNVTQHVYDLAGRQIKVTQAYGTANATSTSYAYDDAGRKTSETDNLGHVTSYTYDNAGNMLSVTKGYGTPSASTTSYTYDNARNKISMTDGRGNTTQYAYDARKRLTVTTYPDQTTKTNAYDGPGNLVSVTDQANNVVQYSYDAANQLVNVVQTASPNTGQNTTIYGYDANGNPITLQDANTHITTNVFDVMSELTSKLLPDATHTETRTYDSNGNLTTVTHFNNVTTTYTYDHLNRLLSRATPGETTVSFTYTATGKRQTMTDQSGTTTYGYDSMDRLTSKATPEGTLSYTYDAAGNLQSMTSNHANGVSATYSYDDLSRLSTVADANLTGLPTNVTQYSYDNASNLGSVQYPNGVTTQFTYDTLNRVMSASSQVAGYTYQRGPTGNLTNVIELGGRTVNWTYDGIYRLTNESIANDSAGNNGVVSYGLDPVGNRLNDTSSLNGISPGTWGYNSDDEVSTESYDANGNVTATGGKTFTYDSENHMMTMSATGTSVGLVYDGDGNRVGKTVNGVTTYYLVDDLNPTGYPQVVEELSSALQVQRQYTYGLQRIDEEQTLNGTWTPSFYGYDGGGNVRNLTNSAGTVTDTYEYDAFGNALQTSGSTPNNYLYRGEQYDSDLGLYYLRARYYNPATGRFMSRDPEAGTLYDQVTLHRYLYAGADPVDYVDPRGRDLFEYAIQSNAAVPEAKLVSIYGCVADVGLTGVSLLLEEAASPGDLLDIAGATFGCLTVSVPKTSTVKVVRLLLKLKPFVDYGFCAADLKSFVNAFDDLLNSDTPSIGSLADTLGALTGCVSTRLGQLLEQEE